MDIDQRLEKAFDDLARSPLVAVEIAIKNYKKMSAEHKRQNEEAKAKMEAQQKTFEQLKHEYDVRFKP